MKNTINQRVKSFIALYDAEQFRLDNDGSNPLPASDVRFVATRYALREILKQALSEIEGA